MIEEKFLRVQDGPEDVVEGFTGFRFVFRRGEEGFESLHFAIGGRSTQGA